ncbi:MAG: bifunctional precorrin-2 dehydrogenase/sirohydrochlorin ferrochelatase [Sphingomonadales bacterium]
MIPLIIDPLRVPMMVVGNEASAARRLASLRQGGAVRVRMFADDPCTELTMKAGEDLRRRLPSAADFEQVRIVFVAGLAERKAARIANMARESGALVQVEDLRQECDFLMPAIVRRGDLMISISTGGRSPGLARRLRRHFEESIGPEWETRVEQLAERRRGWREGGDNPATIAEKTGALIDSKGWLK